MSSIPQKILFLKIAEAFKKNYPAGMPEFAPDRGLISREMREFIGKNLPNPHPSQLFLRKQALFDISRELEEIDSECVSLLRQRKSEKGHEVLDFLRERIDSMQRIVKQKTLDML